MERFVEFVAREFPGYPSSDPSWVPPRFTIQSDVELQDVFQKCLEYPGFFGHHLLTLGYAIRHRDLLSEEEFIILLNQVQLMATSAYIDPEDNIHFPVECVQEVEPIELNLEKVLLHLILHGPTNVHSITLADISYDLWLAATNQQRIHLISFLRFICE